MRRIRTIVLRGGLVAGLLLSAVTAHGTIVAPPEGVAERPQPVFRVRGRVDGLVPGVHTAMRVTVANRYGFPIRVTRVGASVTSPRPACPSSSLRIQAWRGSRRVPAERTRRVSLRVTLRRVAPIDCAGTRFRLHYTGRAVRASR